MYYFLITNKVGIAKIKASNIEEAIDLAECFFMEDEHGLFFSEKEAKKISGSLNKLLI